MMYQITITITRKVEKELERLPKHFQSQIQTAINNLKFNPMPTSSKKLSGYTNRYRLRVYKYRIIYEVDSVEKIIDITKVGHRGDVYKFMSFFF